MKRFPNHTTAAQQICPHLQSNCNRSFQGTTTRHIRLYIVQFNRACYNTVALSKGTASAYTTEAGVKAKQKYRSTCKHATAWYSCLLDEACATCTLHPKRQLQQTTGCTAPTSNSGSQPGAACSGTPAVSISHDCCLKSRDTL
jgi:hypothetical protein